MKPHLNATWLWLHSKRHRIYPHTTRIWLRSYLNTTWQHDRILGMRARVLSQARPEAQAAGRKLHSRIADGSSLLGDHSAL